MYNFLNHSKFLKIYFKEYGEQINYKKGQLVVRPEDSSPWVYFLEKGLVKATFNVEDETERLLGFFVEGATFAKAGVFFKKDSPDLIYEASSNSTLLRLPTKVFLESISKDKNLLLDYLHFVARNNLYLIDRIVYQGSKGTKLKFLKWLQFMTNYYGIEKRNSVTFIVPLTQDDIANFLHTTRESINKTISFFMKEKLISINKKHITIKDLEKLKKEYLSLSHKK